MRTTFFAIAFCIATFGSTETLTAQILEFESVQVTAPDRLNEGRAVDSDMLGNVFVAGFSSLRGGVSNVQVVRFDADNASSPITVALNSGSNEQGLGVSCDNLGSVYVTGFTSGVLGDESFGFRDIFLIRFNSVLVPEDTIQFGTNANEEGRAVVADSNGNIYVAGVTEGVLPSALIDGTVGGEDAFLIKFNSNLEVQWVRQLATPADDEANGVALDAQGNIYIAGCTDSVLPGNLRGTSNGSGSDAFISRYDSDGVLQWTRQIGSDNDACSNAIAFADDKIYIAGSTAGDLPMSNVSHAGMEDAFVSRWDSTGTLIWTRMFGTADQEIAYGVDASDSGHPFITGTARSSLVGRNCEPQFGGNSFDIFTISLTFLGDTTDGDQIGNAGDDGGYAVDVSSADGLNVFVTGTSAGLEPLVCSGGVALGEPTIFLETFFVDLLGDVNCDGVLNLLDVAPFVDVITSSAFFDKADINRDGVVDLLDVAPFVDLLTGS